MHFILYFFNIGHLWKCSGICCLQIHVFCIKQTNTNGPFRPLSLICVHLYHTALRQNGRNTVNAVCLFPFFFWCLKERILDHLFRYLFVISLHLFSGNTVRPCNLCNLKNNEDLKDCSTFKVKITWAYFFLLAKKEAKR